MAITGISVVVIVVILFGIEGLLNKMWRKRPSQAKGISLGKSAESSTIENLPTSVLGDK